MSIYAAFIIVKNPAFGNFFNMFLFILVVLVLSNDNILYN